MAPIITALFGHLKFIDPCSDHLAFKTHCFALYTSMPDHGDPPRRCWCNAACGKIVSSTTRRRHYRQMKAEGRERECQSSDSVDSESVETDVSEPQSDSSMMSLDDLSDAHESEQK